MDNVINNLDYTEERLNDLSIFELRNVARTIGVRLPTTLKKEELVKQVLDVVNGVTKAYVRKTKQGRPPKSNMIAYGYSSNMLPEQLYKTDMSTFLNLRAASPISKTNYGSEFSGVIEISAEGYGMLHSQLSSIVYISSKAIVDYSLRAGDSVSVLAGTSGVGSPLVAYQIESINGITASEYLQKKQIRFEYLPALQNKLNAAVELLEGVKYGQSVLVGVNLKTDLNALTAKIKGNKRDISVINLDSAQHEGQENVLDLPIGEPYKTVVSKSNLFMQTLIRKIENSKSNSVLIINNINKLFKNFNNATFAGGHLILDRVDSTALSAIKKLFTAAKNTESGSLTVIALFTINESSAIDNFLYNELIEIANAYYSIDENLQVDKKTSFNKN